MEPTIYKPSIYKGTGIYKNGANGGGGGGGDEMAPLIISTPKSSVPIGEIEEGVFTARASNVGLTYGKEIDISSADKFVLEISWKIPQLQKYSGYSNGIYLNRAEDANPTLFFFNYESGGAGFFEYKVYDSNNNTNARVHLNANYGTLFSNKTNIRAEFIKSLKQLKVYHNDNLIGTSNLTGPVNYTGVWRPIIGGTRPGSNLENLLKSGDEIYLNETHFYLDDVKQW